MVSKSVCKRASLSLVLFIIFQSSCSIEALPCVSVSANLKVSNNRSINSRTTFSLLRSMISGEGGLTTCIFFLEVRLGVFRPSLAISVLESVQFKSPVCRELRLAILLRFLDDSVSFPGSSVTASFLPGAFLPCSSLETATSGSAEFTRSLRFEELFGLESLGDVRLSSSLSSLMDGRIVLDFSLLAAFVAI